MLCLYLIDCMVVGVLVFTADTTDAIRSVRIMIFILKI